MSSTDPHPPKKIGNDGTVYRCPLCRAHLANADVPTFPFCSERCRLLDLNNWIDGKYKTSRPIDPTDHAEDQRRNPHTCEGRAVTPIKTYNA